MSLNSGGRCALKWHLHHCNEEPAATSFWSFAEKDPQSAAFACLKAVRERIKRVSRADPVRSMLLLRKYVEAYRTQLCTENDVSETFSSPVGFVVLGLVIGQ